MHVVITGASAGIGRALALEFARQGARLTLVARRRPLLEELARATQGSPHLVEQDLADPERAADFLPGAEAAHGPVDVLINNAGVQTVERVDRISPSDADRMIALNLRTPLRLAMAVLPGMRARRSGTIVNLASTAAYAPMRGMVHYAASKAGIASGSELMRIELKGSGVNVVTVYPGYIRTEMGDTAYEQFDLPLVAKLYRPGHAHVLARKVREAVEKRRARVVYPWVNQLPVTFEGTTRFVLDHFGPPLKEPPLQD